MENFVLYDELGRGENTVVYKGRKKGTIKFVAIHRIEKVKRCELTNTVRMIHDLNHPNVVKFDEWYETNNHLWLVVELCTGGSLEKLIAQDGHLPEDSIKSFSVDLISGLHFLHSLSIIFCDLRPSKVLFDCYGKLKYADFGLSKAEEENLDEVFEKFMELSEIGIKADKELIKERSTKGSPTYMAPEVLQGGGMTIPSDMWSLGCVLYEMYTGHPPFEAETLTDLVEKICNDDYPPIKVKGSLPSLKPSPEFQDLIQKLLEKDPSERMTWPTLVSHPFWEGLLDNIAQEFVTASPADSKTSTSVHSLNSSSDFSLTSDSSKCQEKTPISPLLHSDHVGFDTRDSVRISSSISDLNSFKPKMANASDTGFGGGLFTLSTRPSSTVPSELHAVSPAQSSISPRLPESVLSFNKSDKSITEVLYHPTDFSITPIIDNPKITKVLPLKYEPKGLPVPAYSVKKILSLSEKVLQKHITMILESVLNVEKGPPSLKRYHFISYIGTLAGHSTIANVLTRLGLLTHLARQTKEMHNVDMKLKLCRVAGILANSTTYVDETVNLSEPITIFSELLRDNLKNLKLRQGLLPTVGELLYLIASQEHQKCENVDNWAVPSMTHTIIGKCCREEDDVIGNHTAAKVIENVTTTLGSHAQKFATNDIGQSLWYLYKHTTVDSLQITALLALCRITRLSIGVFQNILDSAGISGLLETFSSGITRIQQAVITMFGALLASGHSIPRFLQEKNFLTQIIHLLDHPSDVIRGKTFLVISQLIKYSHKMLLPCCQSRLVMYIERDSRQTYSTPDGDIREGAEYLASCLKILSECIVQAIPLLMEEILSALDPITGRQHVSSALVIKQLRTALPQVAVFQHFTSSAIFRARVVDDTFCRNLGDLLIHVKSIEIHGTNIDATIGPGSTSEFVNEIVSTIYTITQHPFLLQEHYDVITGILLRTLVELTACQNAPTRESCLWLVAEMASVYLGHDLTGRKGGQLTRKLHSMVEEYLLPQCEQILLDQDPLPSYALKLLAVLLSHSPGFIKQIAKHGLIPVIFQVLIDYQHNPLCSSVKTIVKILNCIVGQRDTDMNDLYEQGFIDQLIGLILGVVPCCLDQGDMRYKMSVEMLQNLLNTLQANLKYLFDVVKKAIQAKKHGAEDMKESHHAEQLLLLNKTFIELDSILAQLLCHNDCDIQELATKSLSLMAQLFGGEDRDALSQENMVFFCQALKTADSKKQKVILRIIKRFVTADKCHADQLTQNGSELLSIIQSLCQRASSSADVAITSLASDILKIGRVCSLK